MAAVEFIRRQVNIDPQRIALVGHSMGAIAAIHAATTLQNIQALVSLSSPAEVNSRFAEVWAPLYPKAVRAGNLIIEFPHIGSLPMLGKFHGMISRLWMWTQGYRLRINLEEGLDSWEKLNPSTNIEEMGAFPYEGVLELYERAQPPKELLLSEGGFHAAPLFPGKLREKWISWLVSVLT
jgi:pimeloyl-ACP methyl ester carboxylesterase